jgi:hypothetical protein
LVFFILNKKIISIILNSFTFGLWWDQTMEKRQCVMMSWQNAWLYCFKFLHFLSLVNELHTYTTKKMYKFWSTIDEICGNANKGNNGQGFKFKKQECPHMCVCVCVFFFFYKRKFASLFTLKYMLSYTSLRWNCLIVIAIAINTIMSC